MVKVTNNGQGNEVFHVNGGKKGEPKFETLRGRESRDLDLADRKAVANTAREAIGVITIGDKPGREAGAAVTAANAPDPKG